LERVAELFHRTAPIEDIKFRSGILNDIMDCLPLILEDVINLRSMLNSKAAERGDDMSNLFQSDEPWPLIAEYKQVSATVFIQQSLSNEAYSRLTDDGFICFPQIASATENKRNRARI
jgi:hypothetical protein